jgi:methanogenic corrinoid protein MtbC1
MSHPSSASAERFFDCLKREDAEGALELVMGIIDEGASLEEVVALLADAQRMVGAHWQRNDWTVAQEHAATGITDRVLAAVAATSAAAVMHSSVVVVCAEGEWHTLAPRMLTDLLRASGWDAHFLGGSIPAHHLAAHLRREQPLALAVSCSIPLFLPGALATIAAAHEAGVPALAGGQGFGAGPHRAHALGANAWAPDGASADAVLHRWDRHGASPPGSPDERAVDAYRALADRREPIVRAAEEALLRRLPYLRSATSAQRVRTREDLEYLAGFVEAALLTGDAGILADYIPWLAEVLVSRQVPPSVLGPTVDAFTAALERHGQDEAAALLAAAAMAIGDLG